MGFIESPSAVPRLRFHMDSPDSPASRCSEKARGRRTLRSVASRHPKRPRCYRGSIFYKTQFHSEKSDENLMSSEMHLNSFNSRSATISKCTC